MAHAFLLSLVRGVSSALARGLGMREAFSGAASDGAPPEMRIVGPVEVRVTEMPVPPEEETIVEERDRAGRIRRTTTRAVPA